MKDQKADAKKLIESLNVPQDKKDALLKKLEAEGTSDGLMNEIKACLNEMEDKLAVQIPELSEFEKAADEFNLEMDAIEQETGKVDQQIGKQLDDIELQQTRQALDSK